METGTLFEATYRVVRRADDAANESDWLLACRAFGNLTVFLSELAADLAQEAYDAGATKTKIASALNVSPRDLRGMERRVAS